MVASARGRISQNYKLDLFFFLLLAQLLNIVREIGKSRVYCVDFSDVGMDLCTSMKIPTFSLSLRSVKCLHLHQSNSNGCLHFELKIKNSSDFNSEHFLFCFQDNPY